MKNQFRRLTKDELKSDIWSGKDFPEVIGFSSKFIINKNGWYGYFYNNTLVSICHLKFKQNYLYLHILETHKKFQNKGFGKELINNVINLAKRLNYHEIRVNPRDYRCYDFYRKCGFIQIYDKDFRIKF